MLGAVAALDASWDGSDRCSGTTSGETVEECDRSEYHAIRLSPPLCVTRSLRQERALGKPLIPPAIVPRERPKNVQGSISEAESPVQSY